jgi:hypothetical protein
VTAIGLGWRIDHWSAVVVAVSGPAASPVVVHREMVTLVDDASLQEPYHAAASLVGGRTGADAEPFLAEARALIESVEKAAATAAATAIREFVADLGPVAAVGVVGGNRKVSTELLPNLASHARLHESERNLYEQAVIQAATRVKLPVMTIPATGTLFDDASEVLGVALAPSLAALGKSIGQPWQKNHKEATTAALIALDAVVAGS